MQIPSPLGRKSNPTIDSKRELLPALYEPITTILGRLMCLSKPTSRNVSIIEMNFLRFSKIPIHLFADGCFYS